MSYSVCSNTLCPIDYPHNHEGLSIDTKPKRLPWPYNRHWKKPFISPFRQLFQFTTFTSHSGLQLPWKFDCDAIDDNSIEDIAKLIRWKFAFSYVVGIPRGGLRLQRALEPYTEQNYPVLIVDDVLTTGKSMEEYRKLYTSRPVIGVVIVARGKCPSWIWPIMTINEWTQSRAAGLN